MYLCVERVTHALSVKRKEGDQVARRLRTTIVCGDNSGPGSALLSLSLFCFSSSFFLILFYTCYKCTFCLTPRTGVGTRSWQSDRPRGIMGGLEGGGPREQQKRTVRRECKQRESTTRRAVPWREKKPAIICHIEGNKCSWRH